MGSKRKGSNSSRASTTTNSKDRKDINKRRTKTKGSEEVEYDPVHKGSTRRAQGKVTKVLTGAKKSDPSTKEIRYFIQNDNTGKETIDGEHSLQKKVKK